MIVRILTAETNQDLEDRINKFLEANSHQYAYRDVKIVFCASYLLGVVVLDLIKNWESNSA